MGQNPSSIKNRLRDRPIVLVVGGGYGGTSVAQKLDEEFNVILFDRKDYMFHNVGALRAAVDSDFVKNIIIPYDNLLKYGINVHAEVKEINEKSILIQNFDEEIKFDYLIIATGSNYAFPAKIPSSNAKEVLKFFEQCSKIIKESNNILIIGGGPVGIELSGEIAEKYPEKKITIVQSDEKILPGPVKDELRESILNRIKEHFKNVTIKTNEKVIFDDDMINSSQVRYYQGQKQVKTNQGNTIDCDLIFFCNGAYVNSKAYENSLFFQNKLNDRKRIKVNSKLQVEGSENIFAIGDCADAGNQMAFVAGMQAEICAHNITKHYQKQLNAMKNFIPPYPAMVIPLGSRQGASQFPTKNGYLAGAIITSKVKGQDLLANKSWKLLGYKSIPNQLIIPNKNNIINNKNNNSNNNESNPPIANDQEEEKKEEDKIFEDNKTEEKYRRYSVLMKQSGKMTNNELHKLFEGLQIDDPHEDAKYT